jgi:predicted DNA-binding helix-hairpin-helix protein
LGLAGFTGTGVVRSPEHTMEELIQVARTLRIEHDFRGHIHLKTIPDVDEALIAEAGLYADRLSVNIELPSEASLRTLAPEKTTRTIKLAMGRIRARKEAAEDPKKPFAPAGQSTQLIVGADQSDDRAILGLSETLYGAYRLRRVYYSAYSPIPQPSSALPPSAPPLQRENRLYQADWLIRLYGFRAAELLPTDGDGRLPLAIDPKLAWALNYRERFPIDVNSADREMLLRVPGLGVRNVQRILAARRHQPLRYADLQRLRCDLRKARDFLIAADWHPRAEPSSQSLHDSAARQLELF